MEMEQEAPQQEVAEGQEGGDPIQQAIDGILASTEAMSVVSDAFMQMGQKGPATKLKQASELAKSALQEMMGGGGKQSAQAGMTDPNQAQGSVPVV